MKTDGFMEWEGTEREVTLSAEGLEKDQQKWASMVGHMSLLNIFSALVV